MDREREKCNDFARMQEEAIARNERNDCGVKALALCAGIEYLDALTILRKHGRRHKGRTKWVVMWAAMDELGLMREPYATHHKTVVAFGRRPPKGIYLIATRGHVLCCRFGKIEDWTQGRRHRITHVWRITRTMDPVEIKPDLMPEPGPIKVRRMKTKGQPSSKYIICALWRNDPERTRQDAEKLAAIHHVQFSTIKGWIGEWSRGKNFPTR